MVPLAFVASATKKRRASSRSGGIKKVVLMESFRSPSPAKCSNKREKKKYWPRGSTTIRSLLNVYIGVKRIIYVQNFNLVF